MSDAIAALQTWVEGTRALIARKAYEESAA